MAAPNYEQIQSFGNVNRQLRQRAVAEFMRLFSDDLTVDEIVDLATRIAVKYNALGAELGAQWYDLCSRLAGLDVEQAYVEPVNTKAVAYRASSTMSSASKSDITQTFDAFMQSEINNSERMTGMANLWRDYKRGKAGGKWARVPVGDTCAWCLMLASNGAYYLTQESALGANPDHYKRQAARAFLGRSK